MTLYQFVLATALALCPGFAWLHHLRFLQREPMLVRTLKFLRLPPQCSFSRFPASLASGSREAVVGSAAAQAAPGVGKGPGATDFADFGHRRHCARAVWAATGSAPELEPSA
jgi:hypothetical protein